MKSPGAHGVSPNGMLKLPAESAFSFWACVMYAPPVATAICHAS